MAGRGGSRRGFDPRRRGTRGVGLSVPASAAIAGAVAPRGRSPQGWRGVGRAQSTPALSPPVRSAPWDLEAEVDQAEVAPVGVDADPAEGAADRAGDSVAEGGGEDVRDGCADAAVGPMPRAVLQASPAPGETQGALFVYAGTITSVSGHTCAPPRAIDGACTGVLITPAQVGALLRDDGSEKVKNRRSRKAKNRIRVGSRR